MKMLTVSYQVNEISVFDDVIVYHGRFLYQKDCAFILHNAYDKEVLSLKIVKGNSLFFQGCKKDAYLIRKN